MKKSVEFISHATLWILFSMLVLVYCKHYFQIKPDAPAASHIPYIVFLELIMGLIFFYTTFFGIPLARRKPGNMVILAVILLFLLIVFAYPAISHGSLEVLSSVIPHLMFILLALVFRGYSDGLIRKA